MQQIRYVFYGGIKIENSLQTQTKPTIDEIPKHFEWAYETIVPLYCWNSKRIHIIVIK